MDSSLTPPHESDIKNYVIGRDEEAGRNATFYTVEYFL
jgi:hypothetical protein